MSARTFSQCFFVATAMALDVAIVLQNRYVAAVTAAWAVVTVGYFLNFVVCRGEER